MKMARNAKIVGEFAYNLFTLIKLGVFLVGKLVGKRKLWIQCFTDFFQTGNCFFGFSCFGTNKYSAPVPVFIQPNDQWFNSLVH